MKIRYLTLFFLISILLTGCTTYKELNEIGIVSALGIERKDNQYQLSATLILPEKEEGESSYRMETMISEGASISTSFHEISKKSGRKIMLSHLSFVAIDNSIVPYLDDVLNFFLQEEESRNNFPIVLCTNLTPKELLEQTTDVNEIPLTLEANQKEYGTTFAISLEEMIKINLKSDTIPVPIIKKEEEKLVPDNLAMIKKETIIFLTKEETTSYLYLTNHLEKQEREIIVENETIPISILENHTSIQAKQNHLRIEIDSKIEADSTISSEKIKKAYEENLKRDITHLLEKGRTEKIDLFHLYTLVYQNNPHYFQKEKETLLDTFTYEIKITTTRLEDSEKIKGGDFLGTN